MTDTLTQMTQRPVILKEGARSRAWLLTWNNYTPEDWVYTKEYCEKSCEKYVAQEEIGKEGTPHIQFALYYKNAVRFSTVKNAFPKAHIETAENWFACANYCKKADTSAGERIAKLDKPRFAFKIRDPLDGREPYDWQQEVMELLKEEPDDRSIHWYWEPVGCRGKTSLAKHICLQDPNALYLTGKSSDMKYGVFCAVEKGIDVRTIILDFTRSQEEFVSWQGIEELKNGIFYNTKYESKMCMFNCPHIICFANWEPPVEKLSRDRWVIKKIADTPAQPTQAVEDDGYADLMKALEKI